MKTRMASSSHKATTSCYDTNHDIALLSDLGMGYKKIAKYKTIPVLTFQGVVK